MNIAKRANELYNEMCELLKENENNTEHITYWSDSDEIHCRTEDCASKIANFLETIGCGGGIVHYNEVKCEDWVIYPEEG